MRILVVSAVIPFPPTGGGKLRTFHLTRALAREHEVTLVGFRFDEEPGRSPFPLRVIEVPYHSPPLFQAMESGDEVAFKALEAQVPEPWFVSYFDCREMSEALHQLATEAFDLVLFEGSDMSRFLPLFGPDSLKVVDFMDVHTRMAQRLVETASGGAELKRAQFELGRTRRFEQQIVAHSDLCLACSAIEADAAKSLLGACNIAVIPNGVDTAAFRSDDTMPKSNAILFTGSMDFSPNIEAVKFFVREVFPAVRKEVPDAVFHIVGANPGPQVKALATTDVVVHGFVPDIGAHYQTASVFVAPILSGGGTRLKILEAAASGRAIVTTSMGLEGLDFTDGQDIIIADTPAAFALAVVDLLRNPGQRQQLGFKAAQVSQQYDWELIGHKLHAVIGQLAVTA